MFQAFVAAVPKKPVGLRAAAPHALRILLCLASSQWHGQSGGVLVTRCCLEASLWHASGSLILRSSRFGGRPSLDWGSPSGRLVRPSSECADRYISSSEGVIQVDVHRTREWV